ncbi:hypothetical protein CCR75_008207 [Bremia lactucae]|uniref:Uncharacterized protein n=1 Tax=Bremia lactucae TaxID=4779 RepID=A0A976IGL4_BRELC|nr:hypothetical protein CCR75_008207 [Bremia lactucae]
MSTTDSPILPAPRRMRAPPPPVPTSAPEPTPEIASDSGKQQPAIAAMVPTAGVKPASKPKHRGLVRAIGGFFRRSCGGSTCAMVPEESESSQRRTSRLSRWSHSQRHSLPEAPFEVVAMVSPERAPIQENLAAAEAEFEVSPFEKNGLTVTSPACLKEPPTKKVKAVMSKITKKANPLLSKAKQSPTDPSELLTTSSSDKVRLEPEHVSFLFFGGSDADTTFQPELRPSELDDLHENEIRPSLKAKMPLFFSSAQVENIRRSSILSDPKEYEL